MAKRLVFYVFDAHVALLRCARNTRKRRLFAALQRNQGQPLRIVSLILLSFIVLGSPAFADPEMGKPLPEFVVQDFNGKGFDLSKLRGKVVIIHFWATWCPECRGEMPALDASYRRYRGMGLEVIAVSIDRPNMREKAGKIMERFTYRAVLLRDAKTSGLEAPQAVPVTYVVDKDGMLRDILRPDTKPVTQENLSEVIEPLLSAGVRR